MSDPQVPADPAAATPSQQAEPAASSNPSAAAPQAPPVETPAQQPETPTSRPVESQLHRPADKPQAGPEPQAASSRLSETSTAPTENLLGRPPRPAAGAGGGEPTPGMAQRQAGSRLENQDYLRVLEIYGDTLPPVYIHHIEVAKDMHVGAQSPTGEVYPPPQRDSADVSMTEIAKVRAVFQKPAAYGRAQQVLHDQRCVVLVGRPGTGKRCAAIRLASELLGDGEDMIIRELSGDGDLAQQVEALATRPDVAYLVDDLLTSQGRVLKPLAARRILDTLRKQGSYLVICARAGVPLPRELPAVTCDAPPISAAALVELHMKYYDSGLTAEEISEAFAHEDVAAILNAGLSPALADRLAEQLASALNTERPLEDAVRGFAAAAEDDVQRWFDEAGDDLHLRAVRIALAVFTGARIDPIFSAAKTLELRLQPPGASEGEDKEKKKPAPSPFARKQSDLLAGARKVRRPMATTYSERTMVEVVELNDPNYSRALLKYLWDFPDLRDPLLGWLIAYAVDIPAPQEIRLRAAAAIGALAGVDFDTIQARVFRPWAFAEVRDNDERRRRYAALSNALGMLIWNDECSGTVRDLLQAWLEEGNDLARWAAARAYAQVGLRYPREAMNQWRRILETKGKIELRLTESFGFVIPHPLHMSVVDAIISLFLHAVELPHRLRPVYEQALEGLAAWVQADAADPNAEQVGLPLFVALTAIRLPSDDGDGDPEQWPPAMLTIVGAQPDSTYRRILAGLFRRAVLDPGLQQQTIAALRSWAEAAENDPWLEQTLGAVLAEWMGLSGAGQRERGLLRMILSRWANHPKEPLAVAGRLLAQLKLA